MKRQIDQLSLSQPEVRRHLDDTVRTWIGLRAHSRVDVPALPGPLARLLLRIEEYGPTRRDQWGRWEFSYSENFHRGRLWVPEVDEWVNDRRRELARRVDLEPLWPNGHKFAVCLTHDVDMLSRQVSLPQAVRSVRAAFGGVRGSKNDGRAYRVAKALGRSIYYGISRVPSTEGTIERCIEIEREFGVKSSYFFTVSPLHPYDCVYTVRDACRFRNERKTVASVIRAVAAEGFDVGLHGSYLSARSDGFLRDEKRALEDAAGQAVQTIRQHYLNFDPAITPRLQDAADFRADSTLGFNRNVGFRAGTSLPFRMFDFQAGSAFRILQVPLIIQEASLLETDALELDLELAQRVIRQLYAAVEAVGGAVTVLFHPHTLLDPRYQELYRFAIGYGLEREAWLTSLAETSDWWHSRETQLTEVSGQSDQLAARDRFHGASPS